MIRTGTIYIDGSQFSLDALADTRRARSNPSTFTDQYGEYYVASLQLSADAGVLVSVSSSLHTESERLDLKGKLHVLWWDVEKSYHDESSMSTAWSNFNITAYDTLTRSNVCDAVTLGAAGEGCAGLY